MRYVLLALVLAGCGSSSSDNGDAAAPDLAAADFAPAADLTAADLAALDCAQRVACTRACAGPSSGSCVSACIQRGTSAAMTYFQPLAQCAGPACSQSADGSVAPCSADPSSQACIACVMQNCQSQLTACEMH